MTPCEYPVRRTPKTVFQSLLSVFATIGRQIMMDFGLAGLFDRFEKDFGRPLTLALEALIGLAVASVCFGLIWRFLKPIVAAASSTIQKIADSEGILTLSGVELILLFIFTVSLTFSIVSAVWLSRQYRAKHQYLVRLLDENKKLRRLVDHREPTND